ncbi:Helitron helicase [Phytophthora megakarya]|uniref:Helitron helicase n=1 Tax=Phytophthora megakarya TaxID=4795 RepID=A0A225V1W4_9STRA|nr:Helitron helicase [Phytophthora megakarya]
MRIQGVRPIWPNSQNSCFKLEEGRYPVNEGIGEGDIRFPHDMYIFLEPLEVPPVPNEPRDEAADSDSDRDEDDGMNHDHNSRDLKFMVHDVTPDSDNVSPEADDADDDRRAHSVNALIDAVYPGTDEYFVERTTLATTNAGLGMINEMVAARITAETKYRTQEPVRTGVPKLIQLLWNSPHKIVLRVGTPIIMICNLNSDAGLCDGTRFRVASLRERSIKATVMSWPAKRNTMFVPRNIFYTEDDDKEFPFKLKRKEFPVVPAFTMTINKAQGQSSHNVDIYLESSVFVHGQLNVAISRVTSQRVIKITVGTEMIDVDGRVHTKNIVYREIFDHEVAVNYVHNF